MNNYTEGSDYIFWLTSKEKHGMIENRNKNYADLCD